MKQTLKRWIAACFAVTGIAHGGEYGINVDILSPGDSGYADLPQGVLCIDVFAEYPQSDFWTAAGIRGLTSNDARLRYAPDPNDPGVPVLFSPGLQSRYTTFFSRPRPRASNSRFTNAGAAAAGAYNPTGPLPIATSSEVRVASFLSPWPDVPWPPIMPSNYVARIALDVSAVPEAPAEIAGWSAGPLTDAPADSIFVFRSEPPAGGAQHPGTVHATYDQPEFYGINWGVWFVPEPATITLILAGAGLALVRRRNSG